MINKRNKNGNFPIDKISINVDGTETPIIRAFEFDGSTSTTTEMYPPKPRNINLRTNLDVTPFSAIIEDYYYQVPYIDLGSANFPGLEFIVEVVPEGAPFTLESSTMDLGALAGQVFYGSQTIPVSVVELPNPGDEASYEVTAKTLDGSISNTVKLYHKYLERAVGSADSQTAEFPLHTNLNDTVQGLSFVYSPDYTNSSDPSGEIAQYASAVGVPGQEFGVIPNSGNKPALESVFVESVANANIFHQQWYADVRSAIRSDWWRDGVGCALEYTGSVGEGSFLGFNDLGADLAGVPVGDRLSTTSLSKVGFGNSYYAPMISASIITFAGLDGVDRYSLRTPIHQGLNIIPVKGDQAIIDATGAFIFGEEGTDLDWTSDTNGGTLKNLNVTKPTVLNENNAIVWEAQFGNSQRAWIRAIRAITYETMRSLDDQYGNDLRSTLKFKYDVANDATIFYVEAKDPTEPTADADGWFEKILDPVTDLCWNRYRVAKAQQGPFEKISADIDYWDNPATTTKENIQINLELATIADIKAGAITTESVELSTGFEDLTTTMYVIEGYVNGYCMYISHATYTPINQQALDGKYPGSGHLLMYFANSQYNNDARKQAYSNVKVYDTWQSASKWVDGTLSADIASVPFKEQNPNDSIKYKVTSPLTSYTIDQLNVNTYPLANNLKAFLIDDQTIAVGSDYGEFFQEVVRQEYEKGVAAFEYNWFHDLYTNSYVIRDIISGYFYAWAAKWLGPIVRKWDDISAFTITNSNSTNRPKHLIGRWCQPVSPPMFQNSLNDEFFIGKGLLMNQFAYLRLETPLAAGETINIAFEGQTVDVTYDQSIPARSIKINQMGYPADTTTSKVAYVGSWLGVLAPTLGETDPYVENLVATTDFGYNHWERAWIPTDNPRWNGTFEIRDSTTLATVYTGTMEYRDVVHTVGPYDSSSGGVTTSNYTNSHVITGEETYRMNFADFGTPGKYYIYVPGVGYSWEFEIGADPASRAFYWYNKGVQFQRGGNHYYRAPYISDKWAIPGGKDEVWIGNMPCEQWQYNHESFVNQDGQTWKSIFGSEFLAFQDDATDGTRYREVNGGYADAADFDRRPLHLPLTRYFCDAYEENPSKFYDGQLNTFTAGNGIPDILDEAIWSLEIFRQLQEEDGGIAAWIEADRHESGVKAIQSSIKYIRGTPNRYNSTVYAKSAAQLARCLATVDSAYAREQSAIWTDSAIKAFKFGIDPANNASSVVTKEDSNGKTQTFTFNEETTLYYSDGEIIPAAAALYSLTKDPVYLEPFDDEYLWAKAKEKLIDGDGDNAALRVGSIDLLLHLHEVKPEHSQWYRDLIIHYADAWMGIKETFAYGYLHYSSDKSYNNNFINTELGVSSAVGGGWSGAAWDGYGKSSIEWRSYLFYYAYLLTGEQKYKDAIADALSWSQGANANGITRTTGIGRTYPVFMLQDHSLDLFKNSWEPIPGLTPYNGTGNQDAFASAYVGINRYAWTFNQEGTIVGQFLPGGHIDYTGAAIGVAAYAARQMLPNQRRQTCAAANWDAAFGEYTVWETIAGKVPLAALFLEPGAQMPNDVLTYEPKTVKSEVDGWLPLP